MRQLEPGPVAAYPKTPAGLPRGTDLPTQFKDTPIWRQFAPSQIRVRTSSLEQVKSAFVPCSLRLPAEQLAPFPSHSVVESSPHSTSRMRPLRCASQPLTERISAAPVKLITLQLPIETLVVAI